MQLNPDNLRQLFRDCGDFCTAPLRLGGADGEVQATLCYLDGMVNGETLSREVLRPLTEAQRFGGAESPAQAARLLSEGLACYYASRLRSCMDDVVNDLLAGWCAVVFDGFAADFETKTGNARAINKPESEKAVKGSKDSFVETYRINTSLLRRKLRSAELKLKELDVGRRSRTRVAVVYLEGLTDPEMLRRVEERLKAIDIDGLLTTGDLEEYLLEKNALFPQITVTERPDRFAMELLEGRVGLLVDGIPLAFLLPSTFAEQLRVPEDHAGHYLIASGLTLLRYAALLISVLLPAVYVAITMYHHEMIPTKLMLSIMQSKQDVPFSTAAEALGMLIAFELLQEAGLRLPSSIGETVSILGALVVGQSAVEAKVLSPVVVIVVAVAGITGYTVPNQDLAAALRLCRFAMVLLSLAFGLFGMVIGCILLVYYLCTLESLGTPYLSPFCDGRFRELLYVLLRPPLKTKIRRERWLRPLNVRRQK